VKTAKNVTDKIPVLGNTMHITDFDFNYINEAVEMTKNKDTNWIDWTRYGVSKIMDVSSFIFGTGQLLSLIG
jgi:hypothetical protein